MSLSPDGKLLQAIDASDRMGTLGAILSSARGTLLVADPMHARVFELQPDPDQPGTQRFTDRWYGGRGLGWLQLGDRDDAGLVSVDAFAEVRSLLLAADETLLRYFLPLDRREAWDPDWLKFLLPSADRRILNDQRPHHV